MKTENQIIQEFTKQNHPEHLRECIEPTEPPAELDEHATRYWYILTWHLYHNGTLSKLKTIYLKSFCRELSEMLHNPFYLEPWNDPKHERVSFWLRQYADKYSDSLDNIREHEREMAIEFINVIAEECLSLKWDDLIELGIPIDRLK